MTVYLLHSTVSLARGGTRGVNHYLGHAENRDGELQERVDQHRYGYGHPAKICAEFLRRGAELQLVYVEPGVGYERERQLKGEGHFAQRLCPICRLIEPVLDAIEGNTK